MTRRGRGPERWGRALVLAVPCLVSAALDAEGQGLDEWRDLAQRSTAVVTGVIVEPELSVEDARKRAPRILRRADGSDVMQLTSPREYIVGRLWRFRVEEVAKGDGRLTPQAGLEVFHQRSLPAAPIGSRYLLFLRSPIVRSDVRDRVDGWRSLYGAVLTADAKDVAPFDPSTAYGIAFVPQISQATSMLEVTEANASEVAAIVAAVRERALPSARLVEPEEDALVSGSRLLVATATDDVGVLGVRFQVDGFGVGGEIPAEGTAPFRTTWETTSAPDGPHTLTAVARDGAGNLGVSGGIRVVVDNTPPDLQISPVPSELFPADGRLVTIDVNISVHDAKDPHPIVRLVSVTCPVRPIVGNRRPPRSCDPAKDIVGAEPGADDRQFQLRAARTSPRREYTITYSATDAAGNVTAASVKVEVTATGGSAQ